MAKTDKPKKKHKRNTIIWMLIVLVLYVGVHVLSRTDGMCAFVADKISSGTRQPVSLESCSATPLLGLRIKGLHFQGLDVADAKISINLLALFSKEKPIVKELRIQELDIRFKRVPNTGGWEPLVLHGVGRRLGAVLGLESAQVAVADSLPRFPSRVINEKTLLQLNRAKLVWADESGQELARISDADLKVKTAAFTGRRVLQTLVECGHIKLVDSGTLSDFRLEAFRIEGSEITTILDMADSHGQYDEFASQTLWEDLSLHLRQLSETQQKRYTMLYKTASNRPVLTRNIQNAISKNALVL